MLRPEIPGAEPLDAFAARITAFWAHVESAHRGGTAIAVTHGGVLRGMFTLAAGGDLRRHSPFWADNCSISVLDFYHGAVVVRLFNDYRPSRRPAQARQKPDPVTESSLPTPPSRFLTHDTCRDMI